MEGEPVTAEEIRMEGAPVIGDENAKTSWVVEVEKMLADGEPSRSVEQSIYRVPKLIKDMNSKAYQPQLVSLGPFHHGHSNLLPMEVHKRRALVHLVKRIGKSLHDYIAAVEEVADQLEAAYGNDLGDRWRGENRHWFVEVMVTDGCFLLEILMDDFRDYQPHDPFFGTNSRFYLRPVIRSDMLVMENQLPLLLLHRLYKLVADIPLVDDMGEGISRLVLKFIGRPFQGDVINHLPLKLHPLDLYHTSLLYGAGANQDRVSPLDYNLREAPPPAPPPAPLIPRTPHCACSGCACSGWTCSGCACPGWTEFRRGLRRDEAAEVLLPFYYYDTMPSAVKIHESGIKFKKSKTTSLEDIHFEHGVLSMPVVLVEDSTEHLLLNLMAFERLHVAAGTHVMDYVIFVDSIIDSVEDVALLRSKGVLLGSNNEVTTLFNGTLSRRAVVVGNSRKLHELQYNVKAYCQKPLKMLRAHLIQTYFRNPWALVSLFAAVILGAATLLQTVYTVLPFESKR